jgi:2-dehydro-3-deoxygluconokinase
MSKVICFGELLLRLSPVLQGAWLRNASMPVYLGGAELNVAMALANWDVPVAYCTALPDNYLSEEICATLAEKNIDTGSILFSGNRIGAYFLPQGADLKNEAVIYDRAHSSFASLEPGMLDWDKILKDVSWFHFSAISPALSQQSALVCKEALEYASRKNITISVDLNYRSRLWKYGKQPVEIMPELVNYCDVVMGNIWSADTLLGIPADPGIHNKGTKTAYLEHARQTSILIQRQYPKCSAVAQTFRFDHGGNGIRYFSSLFRDGQQYHSKEYDTDDIIDKAGSGDCFMAGLIYGLFHQHTPQYTINFATAAAFGKLQEKGDATRQRVETIKNSFEKHG